MSKDSDAVLSAARRLVNQLRHASIAAPLAFCASPQRALLVWPTYLASLDAYLLAPPHDAGGDDDDDDPVPLVPSLDVTPFVPVADVTSPLVDVAGVAALLLTLAEVDEPPLFV